MDQYLFIIILVVISLLGAANACHQPGRKIHRMPPEANLTQPPASSAPVHQNKDE